jgi:hypothetical protein
MRQMYVFLKAGSRYHVFLGNWRPASSKYPFDILGDVVGDKGLEGENKRRSVEDSVYEKLDGEKRTRKDGDQARCFIQSDPPPCRLILP